MTNDVAALLTGYEADGFAVAENLIDEKWCDAVVAAAERLPLEAPRAEMNVHRLGGVFEQIMAQPAILQVMDRLVGGVANGLQSQLFFGPPGTKGFHAHQDNEYVEADPACFASAWLALVDVAPANGGLFIYPGTHREGRLPICRREGEDFDARTGVRDETIVPAEYARRDVVVPRGTVVFLHGYVVHGSYPNHSDGRRYALLNTYLRPGAAFRPGRTGGRAEHPLPRAPLAPAA